MTAQDKRLDDAIRTALNGGGQDSLRDLIASLWHEKTEAMRRGFDRGAACSPAGGHIRVVNL